jgi:hypothetical protein
MFSRFTRPSVTQLQALLAALSLVAMALAGSAGGHWN